MSTTKSLHIHEQSMLLSVLLFDGKNTTELLQFLPEQLAQRMDIAKEKFLALPRDERMTQVVLELRRLLLIDEYRLDIIHPSWVEDALMKEPLYLQKMLKQVLLPKTKEDLAQKAHFKFPDSLVSAIFLEQLIKVPLKTALYDPILMRLQSLKTENQNESIFTIGLASIKALGLILPHRRISSYINKTQTIDIDFNYKITKEKNPFNNKTIRKFLVKKLLNNSSKNNNIIIFCGLIAISLYLLEYKTSWQRTIVLGFKKELGNGIESLIDEAKLRGIQIDQNDHLSLSLLLKNALEDI